MIKNALITYDNYKPKYCDEIISFLKYLNYEIETVNISVLKNKKHCKYYLLILLGGSNYIFRSNNGMVPGFDNYDYELSTYKLEKSNSKSTLNFLEDKYKHILGFNYYWRPLCDGIRIINSNDGRIFSNKMRRALVKISYSKSI